ncbi:MAG: hypothetical protein ACYDBJ_10890 [Aggregatilineales bacterium]
MSKGVKTFGVRLIAGIMGAIVGVIIVFVLWTIISALQALGLMGGGAWTGDIWGDWAFFAGLAGFMWGIGTYKMRPGMSRAFLAGLGVFAAFNVFLMLLRWFLSLPQWEAGPALLFGGFAATFAASWGMGSAKKGYDVVETSTASVEHDVLEPPDIPGAFDPIQFGKHTLHIGRTRIMPIVRPLIGPMVIALGVALLVIVVVMLIGTFGNGLGATQVLTNNPSASAINAGGYMTGVTLFGGPVSKLAFFLIVAVLVLGGIGTLGLGLALLMNALGAQVQAAKKMPDQPLDFAEPSKAKGPFGHLMNFLIRLRHFFAEWAADIRRSALHSISR